MSDPESDDSPPNEQCSQVVKSVRETSSTSTSEPLVTRGPRTDLELRLQKQGFTYKQSKYDTFYTPQNDFFYDNSPYLPLNAKRREFRLLRVFPPKSYSEHLKANPQWAPTNKTSGRPLHLDSVTASSLVKQHENGSDKSSLIACEIVDKVAITRMDGRYCVLSYCAGSVKNTRTIIVDGLPFSAFANLECAMRLALHCWTVRHPGKELLLWVDQICIDQSDHLERTLQVKMMKDIYRRSNETFISLDIPGFDDCLSWVSWIYSKLPSSENPPDAETSDRETVKAFITDRLLPPKTSFENLPSCLDSMLAFFTSLESFTKNPWWRRAWVYQEFVVSPRPRFLAGSISIPWSKFNTVVDVVSTHLKEMVTLAATNATEIIAREEIKKDSISSKYSQELADFANAERQHKETEALWKGKWEKKRKEYVSNFHRKYGSSFPCKSFRGQYEHATCCKNCVLRYHVKNFPFLGQFERFRLDQDIRRPGGHGKRVILSLIQEMKPVVRAYEEYQNWHKENPAPIQPTEPAEISRDAVKKNGWVLKTAPANPPRKSKPTSSKSRIRTVAALSTYAQSLDFSTVSSLLKGKQHVGKLSDLKVYLRHSRKCEASDHRDRIYAFLALASQEYRITPDYTVQNTIVHVLIATAQSIITYEKSLNILEDSARGRERMGYFIPSWVPDWTTPPNGHDLRTYATMEKVSRAPGRAFNAANGLPAGDVVYRKDDEDDSVLEMKVRGLRVDVLDVLYDDPVPGFDEFRTFGTLECDLRVTTLKTALDEDEVWVLHGASMPVVLRPCDDDEYSFLGPAVVCEAQNSGILSEIMYGRMIEQSRQAGIETREIWIV